MIKADRCPNCGAVLIIRRKKKYCEYCGSDFLTENDNEHENENDTRTIRYVDEAKLKEAELKEKMFEAEQKKERQEQRKLSLKKNQKRILVISYGVVFAGIMLTNAEFFNYLLRILIIATVVFAIISKSEKKQKEPVNQVQYRQGERSCTSNKSKLTAALLCLFLGMIGVHRFYVGKIGTGLLYLFTGGIFGIGVLVDLIRIICGKFNDKNGYYLR